MKNPFAEKTISFSRLALVAWLIFSVIFVVLSLWRSGLQTSYQLGEQAGVRGAVNQTIAQAQQSNCQPFSVFNEIGRVDLINVACLQLPETAQGETETEG